MRDPRLCKQAQGGGKCGALGLVNVRRMDLMLGVPGDQRLSAFNFFEEASPPRVPIIRFPRPLNGVQRCALGDMKVVEQRAFVAIPAPGRALDPEWRKYAQIRIQSLQLCPRQRAHVGVVRVSSAALVAVHAALPYSPYLQHDDGDIGADHRAVDAEPIRRLLASAWTDGRLMPGELSGFADEEQLVALKGAQAVAESRAAA